MFLLADLRLLLQLLPAEERACEKLRAARCDLVSTDLCSVLVHTDHHGRQINILLRRRGTTL